MHETAVDLSRPFTAQRARLYLAIAGGGSTVSALCYLGVGLDVLAPNRAVDVVGNLFSFLPMVLLPLAVWRCTAPGIGRAAELVLVWLPFTAAAQLSFGIVWLIGQPFDLWKPTADPGWTWLWWQFALSDTRYFGDNPYIFAIELTAVLAFVLVALWQQLDHLYQDAGR